MNYQEKKLIKAYAEFVAAERKWNEVCREVFKAGLEVRWKAGKHVQAGVVIDDARFDRVRVRNSKTGVEYAIDADKIVHCLNEEGGNS